MNFKIDNSQAQEIRDRLKYFYGKIDGSYEFPNSAEGDILHMVHVMLEMGEEVKDNECG